MRWNRDTRTLELSTRNVRTLTEGLDYPDDPQSVRMLRSRCGQVIVRAVETTSGTRIDVAGMSDVITVTRMQLADLAVEGTTISIGDVAVVSVPDTAHYANRRFRAVVIPSGGEVPGWDTSHSRLRHICEVCGVDEILTPEEAFTAGWYYPPGIGRFGVIGPRKCPSCGIDRTVWWALTEDGYTMDMLTSDQQATIDRILGEPESITVRDTR